MKPSFFFTLFCVFILCSNQALSLTSGSTTFGTIPMGEVSPQSFSASAGDGAVLFSYSSTYPVKMLIKKPGGVNLANVTERYISSSLPDSGSYNVDLYYSSSTVTGGYSAYYVKGGSGVSNGTIESGENYSGSLPTNGLVSYQLTADAGESIRLHAAAAYNIKFLIYRPDGTYWTGGTNRVSATIPNDGTYNVVLYGQQKSDTGAFTLYYVQGAGDVSDGTIESGQSYSGTLPANGMISYQFEGKSGEVVRLNTDCTYNMYIAVYKPDGSYWTYGNDRFSSALPATTPDTGTYTVILYGQQTSDNGDYTLYYVNGAGDVSDGALESGESYEDILLTNELISYQIELEEDEGFHIHTSSSDSIRIDVYEPDGSRLGYGTNSFKDDNLAVGGVYNVVLSGVSETDSGVYNLYYAKGGGNVSEGYLISTLTRTDEYEPNSLKSFKFFGISGETLDYTTSVAFSGSRNAYFYRPDGSLKTYGSTGSFTLDATGIHTLIFYSYPVNVSGEYSVSITTPQGAPAATEEEKVGQDTQSCETIDEPETTYPINFDVGFKKLTQVDYNAGGLMFSRIYRSDSTWTDNTIGEYWRHNYARTLDVTASTVEITDGTGATTTYTLSGSDWVPDDADVTATFETVGSNYVYTLPNNVVEKYNSSEQLTRIEYLGGGAVNLSYNGSGQLTSVTNENGRSLTLTYSSGRVATLVTPDGTFSYSYDANDNMDEVTKPDTNTIEYHYEDATYVNALTGITDEEGIRVTTYDYDGNGKAILSEYAGNAYENDVTYNVDGTSTVTNALGKDTTYHFINILGVRRIIQVDGEASTNCVASNRYYNYDDKGRLIGKTDWEYNTTRYEYDDRGNITKVKEGAGTDEEQITTITYNNDFNLPELVTEEGITTDYDYDTYGRLTSVTVTDTATSETRITTYTYFANSTDGSGNTILGRLEEIDGPRTDVTDTTEFTYDANLDLETITNALGQVSEITARDSAGRVTTFEDVNDVETDLVYDTNGWLTSSTRAPGTALEAVTTYTYDDNGNLVEVQLPNGVSVFYSYDNAQRLTGIEDELGNTITYTLDNAGNITQEDIEDSTPTLKYTHSMVFDELSRIIESTGAAAQTAEYAYDKNSNLTTYTDPNTNDTSYSYDALQRLVDSTDALSGVTELEYNELDYLTSVEDQRDNVTTYTYNAFGDVIGETSPDRGTIAYTVDKAGNITQMTDARSVVTDYTYDAINRLTDVEYPSDSSLDAALTYDSVSGCGTAPLGRLCSVTDAAGTTTYKYNDLGHMTEMVATRGGNALTVGYEYDLAGLVTEITLPSGREIDYTYNANGQVTGVSADINATPTSLASSITYLPFGPMNAMTYGNSLTFSATYDQDYYLTNRAVSGGIYNHTYDTDANGNITQIGGTTYDYDALNRLDEEDDGSAVTYTYDATSNRLTKVDGGTTSTTVPSTSNKISAVGGNSYTYDAAGNITDDGTNDYTWNAAGQLAEVEISSVTVGDYDYDMYNLRSKKVASATTTYYVYGLGGLLYGEYDTSGNYVREYVYLNGQPLAQIDDVSSSDVLTYLHTDHLGTPKFATNTGGTQVWAANADAFGLGTPSGSVTVNIRMPGQYYDSESNLFYNWNRYYNPAIGRYISSDPIGLAGGLNTFNYANVSPLMYSDPNGLELVGSWVGKPTLTLGIECTYGDEFACLKWSENAPYVFRFSVVPWARANFRWVCEDTCTGESWQGEFDLEVNSNKALEVQVPLPACIVAIETVKRLKIPLREWRVNVLRGACAISIYLKYEQLSNQAIRYIETLANSRIEEILKAGASNLCVRREKVN